jgi:small acid-soluble spore protein (thioredoxin-like protein)
MEMAEEMIAKTDNEKTIKELLEKNERRRSALEGMRKEIRGESIAREKGYK